MRWDITRGSERAAVEEVEVGSPSWERRGGTTRRAYMEVMDREAIHSIDTAIITAAARVVGEEAMAEETEYRKEATEGFPWRGDPIQSPRGTGSTLHADVSSLIWLMLEV